MPHFGVSGKARCALQQDAPSFFATLREQDPYVTAAYFDEMRRKSFGLALITQPPKADALAREIQRYDVRKFLYRIVHRMLLAVQQRRLN